MDVTPMIVTALAVGSSAAIQDAASNSIRDAYGALRKLIVSKFDEKSDVVSAVKLVEKKPDSTDLQQVLSNELQHALVGEDQEVLRLAQALIVALRTQDAQTGTTYTARLTGAGAIAQGDGATAVGARGVSIGGDNTGNINTGTQITNNYYQDSPAEDISDADRRDPVAQKLYTAFTSYAFALDDLEDLCFELGIDWDEIRGENKSGKARNLVLTMQRQDRLQELLAKARAKRPRYAW